MRHPIVHDAERHETALAWKVGEMVPSPPKAQVVSSNLAGSASYLNRLDLKWVADHPCPEANRKQQAPPPGFHR